MLLLAPGVTNVRSDPTRVPLPRRYPHARDDPDRRPRPRGTRVAEEELVEESLVEEVSIDGMCGVY